MYSKSEADFVHGWQRIFLAGGESENKIFTFNPYLDIASSNLVI